MTAFLLTNPFWALVALLQLLAGIYGLYTSNGRAASIAMAIMMMLYSLTSLLMIYIELMGSK